MIIAAAVAVAAPAAPALAPAAAVAAAGQPHQSQSRKRKSSRVFKVDFLPDLNSFVRLSVSSAVRRMCSTPWQMRRSHACGHGQRESHADPQKCRVAYSRETRRWEPR